VHNYCNVSTGLASLLQVHASHAVKILPLSQTRRTSVYSRLLLNTSSSQAAALTPSFVSMSSVIFVKLVLQILWPNWYCSPLSVFSPCVSYQVTCTTPHRMSTTHSTPHIRHIIISANRHNLKMRKTWYLGEQVQVTIHYCTEVTSFLSLVTDWLPQF